MKLGIKDGLKHIFYIELEISGDGINTFFNMCRKKDIIFFDVQHIKAGNNAVRARIARNDFFMIKNLVKAARVHIKVIKKAYPRYYIFRYRQHYSFAYGVLIAFVIIKLLGMFVWKVNFNGNYVYTDEYLKSYIKDMKVYNGNMLKNIDCAYIEECIRNDLDVTWASVEIKGSMVNVYIKENYSMNKEAVKSVYSDGEDIVSSCQGAVKKIITRSGTPLVACGDEVQEGQVLVSGRVAVTDDSGTELYQVDVCPDADILVHTVIAYDDILEREYEYRQYTKRRYSSLIIENNSGLIKLTKPHRRIEQYDIITQKYPLIVAGGIDTGIVIGVENRKEYKVVNDRYNDVQLEDILNERLQMYISHMEQKGVQIMDCRVNIDTTDDRGSCTGELEVLLPVTN